MCAFCNKTTDKYSSFRSHCYGHAMAGRYGCSECGKTYSTKSLLTTHQKRMHCDIPPYFCNYCLKRFKTNSQLRMHQQQDHAEQPNIFPCEECGKILRTKGGLTSHMAVHKLGMNYICYGPGRKLDNLSN